jgi:hypothetical protein
MAHEAEGVGEMNDAITGVGGNVPRIRALLATVLSVVWLLGCAATPNVEYDRDVRFGDYRTFAWAPPERDEVEDPVLDSGLLDRRVQRAATAVLSERGFDQVSPEEADFLVTYHTATRERLTSPNVRVHLTYGVGYPYYPAWYGSRYYPYAPYTSDSRSYREGTLILDIVDRDEERLIWRGWRSGEVRQSRYTEEQVLAQVRSILSDFPPGAASSGE